MQGLQEMMQKIAGDDARIAGDDARIAGDDAKDCRR